MSKLILLFVLIIWINLFLLILLIFIKTIHPFILITYRIFFNIIISLNISIWYINYIYSILLFLIIIRGLLIIFIYFSSLISNEQILYNFNIKYLFLFTLNYFILIFYIFKSKYFYFYLFNFSTNKIFSINVIFSNKLLNLINLYNYPSNNFTILRIFFILLTFITIIKINSSSHSLTLRKIKYYE